jgi:transcriptional regulator with XRE-family HTH domain
MFAKNIRKIRLARDFTQAYVAEHSKITKRYYQEIEAGRKSPTVGVVVRLRKTLKCTWDELFKGL